MANKPLRVSASFEAVSSAASYTDLSAAYLDLDTVGGFAQVGAKGAGSLGLKLRTVLSGVALTVMTFTSAGAATIASGLTVTAGGVTVTAGGLTVSAGGATITGSLGGVTTLTVSSTSIFGSDPGGGQTFRVGGSAHFGNTVNIDAQLTTARLVMANAVTAASALSVQSSLTTSAGTGMGIDVVPTIIASANNDSIIMQRILGAVTPGTFTGLSWIGLQLNGVNVSTWSSPADPISLSFGNINGGGLTTNAYQIKFGTTSGATNNYVMQHANFNVQQTGLARFAQIGIGVTGQTNINLAIGGSIVANGGAARGAQINPTLTAAANNDVLSSLYVTPVVTPGSFTGVQAVGINVTNYTMSGFTTPADQIMMQIGTLTATGMGVTNAYSIKLGSGPTGATNNYLIHATNFQLTSAGGLTAAGLVTASGGLSVTGSFTSQSDANNQFNLATSGSPRIFRTTTSGTPNLIFSQSEGSIASPASSSNGRNLAVLAFQGFNGSAYATGAEVVATTTQAWATGTPNSQGTQLLFLTTPNGSQTLTTALTLGQDQSATFAGAMTVTGAARFNGNVGVNTAATTTVGINAISTMTGGTQQTGILSTATVDSTATSVGRSIYAKVATSAAAFTVTNAYGIQIDTASAGAGSTISNLYGLRIENQTAGATNFALWVGSGQTRFNDAVVFQGAMSLNALNIPASITSASGSTRAIFVDPTHIAAANNDLLNGIVITNSYTPGSFTGLNTVGIRIDGWNTSGFTSPGDPVLLGAGHLTQLNGTGATNAYAIKLGAGPTGATNNYLIHATNFQLTSAGAGTFAGLLTASNGLTVVGTLSTPSVTINTNTGFLKGTTTTPTTVSLIGVPSGNTTQIRAAVDGSGVEWTNQAATSQWMVLNSGTTLKIWTAGSATAGGGIQIGVDGSSNPSIFNNDPYNGQFGQGNFNLYPCSISGGHGAGAKIMISFWSGSTLTNALSVANVSSGAGTLSLMSAGGDVMIGLSTIGAVGDTTGYLYISTCSGTPTGVPANASANRTAIRYDSSAHKLWVYDQAASAWKGVLVT